MSASVSVCELWCLPARDGGRCSSRENRLGGRRRDLTPDRLVEKRRGSHFFLRNSGEIPGTARPSEPIGK